MSQAVKNINIDQGADQILQLACRASGGGASDLSGYTDVTCYIAQAALSESPIEIPAAFMTSEGETSATGTSTGIIQLSPTGTQTRPIAWKNGVWQVWVTAPTGERVPLMGGQVTISQQVPASAA
jgi:hypothetical protein